jgi:hypothetical protein
MYKASRYYPKKIRALPIKRDAYFGHTRCAICLNNDKLDIRRPSTRKIAKKVKVLEPVYADKSNTIVILPAGVHIIHNSCEHYLSDEGISYEPYTPQPRTSGQVSR